MKYIILILVLAALATATPKLKKPHFRNIYRTPVHELETRSNPRILGGQEAVPHSIPYQALVEIVAYTWSGYCGGTLLSANYALTAGHCGVDALAAAVVLGVHNAFEIEDSQLFIVTNQIIVHEDFVDDEDHIINDICVLKLPDPVTFNEFIQPVVLPSRSDNLYEGSLATASGWGYVTGQDAEISHVLNVVNLTIISNTECATVFGDIIISSIICTSGVGGVGVCNGDSGGPLVVDGVQVGVASFGVGGCPLGYPDGYTRVTSFLNWIETNTDVIIN